MAFKVTIVVTVLQSKNTLSFKNRQKSLIDPFSMNFVCEINYDTLLSNIYEEAFLKNNNFEMLSHVHRTNVEVSNIVKVAN